MKRLTILFLVSLSLLTIGCEDFDVFLAPEAGIDAVKVATLSDETVRDPAAKTAQFSDSQKKIAARRYGLPMQVGRSARVLHPLKE